MKEALLEYLWCRTCDRPYELRAERKDGPEVVAGALRCACPMPIPITDGIPRFVPDAGYASSFSFEWNIFRHTQTERFNAGRSMEGATRREFQDNLDFPLADLRNKVMLDAGCGPGRFTDVALSEGATVIGFDYSRAVDSAYRLLGTHPRVHLFQGDLFHLPLKPGSFDLVLSMGVLHHTPDPPDAFRKLVLLVKEGGGISIRVYDHSYRIGLNDAYRRLTRRLPRWLLLPLCAYSIPWHYIVKILPRGRRFLGRLLLHLDIPQWRWRLLDTFDYFSPWHQFYYTREEVTGWYQAAGLRDIHATCPGCSFIGRKPAGDAS